MTRSVTFILAALALAFAPIVALAASVGDVANPIIDRVQGEVAIWLAGGVVSTVVAAAGWFGSLVGIRVVEKLNRDTLREAAERYANGLIDLAQARYLDANPGNDDDAWEFTADVSRDLTDRIDARLRFQYSPDSAGGTRSWTWVEARGRVRVHDRVRVSAAVGRREQVNSRDYTAWNIGADFKINDHARLDLRWYDTDVTNPSAQYDEALVAVLNLGF